VAASESAILTWRLEPYSGIGWNLTGDCGSRVLPENLARAQHIVDQNSTTLQRRAVLPRGRL